MKKVTGAKVTGAVVALTMCLNSVPSTALAESESPRGGDIKAVSEAEERTEDSVSEESTSTEEVKADETEKVDAEGQEEGISEGDTQEEESKPEETNGNENSEQAEKSKEEINQPTEEEKQPAQEAVALTAESEAAVQAEQGVAELDGTYYTTLQEAIDDISDDGKTINLYENVTEEEICNSFALTINMNGHSITGDVNACASLTLNNGTVEGDVTVDGGSFVMTAPANADVAIKGNLIVNSGYFANISGAKVGVKGDSVQIDTDEEVIISGTDKAVELTNAIIGSSSTIFGSATVDGDVSQAEFSDGTYKVGEEVAKKITNVSNGQVAPKADISFAADSESKSVVAGNSVTFTVKYDGKDDLTAYVQKSANVNIATTIAKSEENTYTVTVTPSEDVKSGEYTVFVHEINNTTVQAEATLNITEAGAKVTIGDTTTYYATLAEMFTDTPLAGGSVVTVLKDESDAYVSHYIYTEETGITLDLNGKRLGSNLYVGKVANSNGNRGKVTIIDSVGNGSCTIYVGTNGTLIFAPESSGTIGYIFSSGGDITLSGGQVVISNIDSTNKPITDFLADGYAYKDKKGNWIEYATAKKLYMSNSQYPVFYVVQCDHSDIVTDDTGRINCKYCNKELEVSVEWKSGDTTKYFKDLKTALTDSAVTSATSGTLKLLENDNSSSLTINSGNFDLDLNGKNINSLRVTGGNVNIKNTAATVGEVAHLTVDVSNINVTLGIGTKYSSITANKSIGSMLVSGAAMKVDGTYATEEQLNNSEIGSVVEVVEIPLTIQEPTEAQLNSIVYKGNSGTVPFVFSRNDSSDNEITVTYKIDDGNEITKTVTGNEIDLLSELNQFSAGNYTLVLSATYSGYTTPSKTYNFKIAKSTPTIRWNGYPYGKFYTGSKIANPLENDDITIENGGSYSDIEFKWYTKAGKELADNPVNAGDYIIKAVFAETPNTNAATYQCNITIGKKAVATENGKTIDGDVDVYITSVEQTYEVDLKDVLNNVEGVLADDNFTLNTNYGGVVTYGLVKSAVMENGKVKISMPSLEQIKNPTDGIGHVNVALSSTNYSYIPLSLNVNAINKQEKAIDSNYITMDSWTYGEERKTPQLFVMTEGSIPSTYAVSYAKKDGTALNGVPIDAGEYTVTVSYETKDCIYKGTKDFTIKRKSIEGATVTLDQNSFVYDGEVKGPKVTSVVIGEVTLTAGTDYGSECEQKIDVGTYTLKVVANDGNYTGEVEVPWSITAKDMTTADVTIAGGSTYTGESIEPEITIKDGSKVLAEGTDYDVTYSNNTNAGTANADITFKGNYSGNIKKTFEIARKPITADIEFTKTFTYTGSEIKPTVVLKDGNTTIPESEYNVSYESNTNAGTGKIIVTNKDGGNYAVNRIEETFTIEKAEGEATAPTAIENIVYTSREQVLVNAGLSSTGEMQYKIGENGTYTAELPKAVNAGEYTVFYKSVGDNNHNDTEEGSITVSIARKDIADATVTLENDSRLVYNGEEQLPVVTSVVVDSVTLTAGTDYSSECEQKINVGTYTLTVSAKGNNYTGSVTVPWSITPKPVTATLEVTGTYTYTGSAIVPTVVVKEDIPENEYTLYYEDNVKAGTGKVIVLNSEGGNYIVNGKTTFTINKAKVTIKALDKSIRKGNAAPDLSNPVAGTDYEVTGLIGGDVLGGTVSLRYSDDLNTSAVGTAEIIPTATGINPNYEADCQNGTLQIRKRPSSSDDSDSTVSNPTETPSTDNGKADSSEDGTKQEDGIKQTIVKMQIDSKNLSVNGVVYEKDAAPVIRNDRTLVPIRFITESLGGKVDWNGITKTVTLTIDGREIKMTIGKTLEKYGVAPVIIDGRTFVPVRFVADELGANVAWDDATKTVTITK